jgi:type III secretion system YscQ/HrcQ family protein
LLRGVLRALVVDDVRALSEAKALLGTEAHLSLAGAELVTAASAQALLQAPSLVLWLEHVTPIRNLALLCELAPEAAAALVDRVLGGDGRAAHPAGAKLDPVSTGVLGYFAARTLAAAESGMRLRAVLDDAARVGDLLGEDRVLLVLLGARVGDEPSVALRLFVPLATALELARRPAAQNDLAPALQSLPLGLCAHAATITLALRELRTLAPGDVLVPERCMLAREGHAFAGEVELHVVGSRRARFTCQARGQQLTLMTRIDDGEIPMTESKRIETQALELEPAALADDAPIELCLTLARFTLPLQELSALRPGEVLSTGRAIGERASLCSGSRTLAHGELCEVDGEIGLRITEIVGR